MINKQSGYISQLINQDKNDAVLAPANAPEWVKEPEPLTQKPANEPALGMVYDGLEVAPQGDSCVGVYRTDTGLCTHGPDEPPKGIDIKKSTPPAANAKALAPTDPLQHFQDSPTVDGDSATTAAAPHPAAGPTGQTVKCDGNGSAGNRVQVVYVHAPGKDRFSEYYGSFRKWAADADMIYSASAKETGGVRHIRYVTETDCTPTVLNIELPASALAEFSATNRALAAKGLDRRDRKYMIFADTQIYCGIGTFNGDERPSQDNQSNFGPSYGRTDSGCWGGHTAAHELGHNLGAVNNSAPNTSRGAHCTDEYDLMCYTDTPYYPKMRNVCSNQAAENILDCNHDDYFHTSPKPGSYLATHWNIANNQFLMRTKGKGGGTDPGPTTPGPDPKPTPTHGTPKPGAGPAVTATQVQSDSVTVSWPRVKGAVWYEVLLNGKHLTWNQGTFLRIQSLRPGTPYTVAVSVRNTAGRDSVPGKAASFRTPGAGGGGAVTPSTAYLLSNRSTGLNAEIWGGRSSDNTVLVASAATGSQQQQWYFDDRGGGLVRIRSAVSGKCLQRGGESADGMWVAQQPCNTGAVQLWKRSAATGAVTITDPSGHYALAVTNRGYYGAWLLELQQTDRRAAQIWTLQKAS
ncbi:RICIN domain-containing protein [Streptomyces sp. NPDC085639]|uniref:RICIN domain-containing protein n=1 Tax=unclassified Streptomyces TaxID=2593676 RepID=UPI0037D0AE3F